MMHRFICTYLGRGVAASFPSPSSVSHRATVRVSTTPRIAAQLHGPAHIVVTLRVSALQLHPACTHSPREYAMHAPSHAWQSLERGSCCKGAGWPARRYDQGCMRLVISRSCISPGRAVVISILVSTQASESTDKE